MQKLSAHQPITAPQTWDSDSYQQHTGFVPTYGRDVLQWLAPQKGEKILDLGCGDGVLTREIALTGADVIGIDASDSFIKTAQAQGLNAYVMDGHQLTFHDAFDAVFSNAALHWMLEPEKVIAGVKRALKHKGRFVGELGGFGNVAAISTAMRAVAERMGGDVALAAPWFFPTRDHYASMLQAQGFEVLKIELFHRPTPIPNGIRSWLEVMRAPFFNQFVGHKEQAYAAVESALKPALCDHQGQWIADYVRLRFHATID